MSTWAHDGRLMPADEVLDISGEVEENLLDRHRAARHRARPEVLDVIGHELVTRAARGIPLGPLEAVVACNWILEHRAAF